MDTNNIKSRQTLNILWSYRNVYLYLQVTDRKFQT